MKYNFKLIILFFVLLYALVTFVFFSFYKSLAIKDTKEEALSTLNIILSVRKFISHVQRPLLEEWQKETGKKIDFDPRLMSATYISEYIYGNKILKKELKYDYKLVSTNPINPIHKPNGFEKDVLKHIDEQNLSEYFSLTKEQGRSYFYLAVPVPIDKNDPSCIKCHSGLTNSPQPIEDMQAIVSLKVPVLDILSYHKQEFVTGGIVMFVVFILFIIFIYMFWKKDNVIKERNEMLLLHQNRHAVMGEMLGNISHQWKQPLTQLSYILMNIDISYKKGNLDEDTLEQKIDEAHEQIGFMSETIGDFKDFFSPVAYDKKPISEITSHAKRLLESELKKNSIELNIYIKDDFVFSANPNEITQVLVNIINNAKDALKKEPKGKGRHIYILAYAMNEENIIEIENDASPIKQKDLKQIFEPYFSTKEQDSSSGIGLYICKTIVEKFNGNIEAFNLEDSVLFRISFKNKQKINKN